MKPIILDRSRLEQYATCPMQAYLSTIWDALKAKHAGLEVFPHEEKLLDEAAPHLFKNMSELIRRSTDSKLAIIGTQIHDLIEKAFAECKGDREIIPQWFVDNLPKVQPNIQPMAIRHARNVGDIIADYHIPIIGVERQLSIIIVPETATTPAIIATMRYDLVGSGNNCLHIMDWKTGYKSRTNSETADSFQAQFGAWLIMQQPEYAEINTVHFWYFETMWGTKSYAKFVRNEEHPRLPGLTTEVALKERILSAVRLFQANSKECWPMEETCAWCPMIEFCPNADMTAKTIADDPKAFVDRMVVIEAYLKNMKKSATEWVKARGEIEGSRVIFTKKIPAERFTVEFQDKNVSNLAANDDMELGEHFKKKG